MESNESSRHDVIKKLKVIGLMTLGALLIIIHIAVYKYNDRLFSVFISLYFILYTVIVLYYLYNNTSNKDKDSDKFKIMTYYSFYTLTIQIVLFMLSVLVLFVASKKKQEI
jgi:hypothetical protein